MHGWMQCGTHCEKPTAYCVQVHPRCRERGAVPMKSEVHFCTRVVHRAVWGAHPRTRASRAWLVRQYESSHNEHRGCR